jgi:hypothetical protein
LPLFASDLDGEGIVEPAAHLKAMTEGEEVVEDYVAMRLTLRRHPMAFLRPRLTPGSPPIVQTATPPRSPGPQRITGLTRTDIWGRKGDPDPRHESTRS